MRKKTGFYLVQNIKLANHFVGQKNIKVKLSCSMLKNRPEVTLSFAFPDIAGQRRISLLVKYQLLIIETYILRANKFAKSAFQSQKIAEKVHESQHQNLATKVHKSLTKSQKCAVLESLKPRTRSLDIYGISSQHFDTSLKLLLLTKFNRANLVILTITLLKI